MKRKFLLLALCAISMASFASNGPDAPKAKHAKKSKKAVQVKKTSPDKAAFGRQCCTVTEVDAGSGVALSYTACAGWFLSNDANALTRACAKAREAAAD